MEYGFAELGDKGGSGIGLTTFQTLRDPEFLSNPYKVPLKSKTNKPCDNFVFGIAKVNYENMPIQIYRKFFHQKMKIFRFKNHSFHVSAQNIDCGYSLEPPRPIISVLSIPL